VLSQSDLERERYEARRKAQLDYNTGLIVARLEGREEGRQEGRQEGWQEGRQEGRREGRQEGRQEGLIDIIHLCEGLLGRAETSADRLAGLSLEELTGLANNLRAELRKHM